MVDIEINNRDARETGSESMGRSDCDVVKDTGSHCPFPACVVPRWADATERRVHLATQHQIHPVYDRARSAMGGVQAVHSHRCVRIEHDQTRLGCLAFNGLQERG